jgi:hypothetical protein
MPLRNSFRLLPIVSANDSTPVPKKKRLSTVYIAAIVILLVITGGGAGILILPVLFTLFSLSYLTYIFAGMGLALIVAIVAGVLLAISAFGRATDTAVDLQDATVLATFFWLGLSLILIYHVLWVIYMTVMLSIWPFKTISPSGK